MVNWARELIKRRQKRGGVREKGRGEGRGRHGRKIQNQIK